MYEAYFGLKEKPFTITPDADFLYMSGQHRAALTMLEYGVFEQSGVTVITGGVGTGKTTLIRHLLSTIPPHDTTVGLISNVHEALGSLLQWTAIALEIDLHGVEGNNVELFLRLQRFLVSEFLAGRKVVLLIDEAHNMQAETLEELRMLLNVNADKNQLLHIALVGQPSLRDSLTTPEMDQLAQRVTAEFHLTSMDFADTSAYVQHRVRTAGSTDQLFSRDGLYPIYFYSSGIPRLVNTLCDHALTLAYGAGRPLVDFDTALEVANQKMIGGVARGIGSMSFQRVSSEIPELSVDQYNLLRSADTRIECDDVTLRNNEPG